MPLSPSHLGKLAGRIGGEWVRLRDAQVQAYKEGRLSCAYGEAPQVAAVMVDGGRLQSREGDQPRGVHQPRWREFKAACCLTLVSQARVADPQPQPPAKFLDPPRAARLAAEIRSRRSAATGRSGQPADRPRRGKRGKGNRGRPRKRVRTVLASMAVSEEFGWQVAAEVHRRGLHRARRKGYICDGSKYNWSIFEMHLEPQGFVGILDFVHLLSYLYGAAQASAGKGSKEAWGLYERWLRRAWGGQVDEVVSALKAASKDLGEPPPECGEDDPRRVVAEALGYVRNNRGRMDYPRYRRLGLPISSAMVESTVKQLNRRIKGTEKFWVSSGAEAFLLLRAAHLSEDGTADRYWGMPRPRGRAVGAHRLRPT